MRETNVFTWDHQDQLTHVRRWGELDKETVQERLNFDLVTRKLLAGLEPVVMAEQVHWLFMLLPVVARAHMFG